MNKNEIREKYGIASGQNREGKTPDGVKHLVEALKRGYDHPLTHGNAPEGKTPQNLNKMLAAEKAMNLMNNRGMSL